MQKLESKKWTSPKIVVSMLEEEDILTVSANDILVTDESDDAKPFKGFWYEN